MKRNILLILTDQQRYDTLGVNGNSIIKTPNLDNLAQEGIVFDNAYTVCGLCSPARASIFSGLYPHTHRMINNCDMLQWVEDELPKSVSLITRYLKENNYHYGYAGKWHIGTKRGPGYYGFKGMNLPGYGDYLTTKEYNSYLKRNKLKYPQFRYDDLKGWHINRPVCGIITEESTSEAHFLADYTVRLIKKLSQKGNFFITCSFWGPHAPYLVCEPYASMYKPEDIPPWGNINDKFINKPGIYRKFRDCFQGQDLPHWTWKQWSIAAARYYGYITMIDSQIGYILDYLKQSGLYDSTIVIFVSDHGDLTGAHGGMKDKSAIMCEEVYHIPMIISGAVPSECKGKRISDMVSNIDIAPTILQIAQIPVPEYMQSPGLGHFIYVPENKKVPKQDYIVSEFHGHRFFYSTRMVRTRKWKYIFNAADIDELYNIYEDPWELENLIDNKRYSHIIKNLREKLIEWMQSTDDPLMHHAQNLFRVKIK